MTATTIRVQMAQRKDTAANWTSANPILLSGEIGYETDTKKFKIGNGSSNWNSLAYLPIPDGSGNLTITGNLEIGSTGSLTFEGSTADGFETTLAVTNPTADRTITLPDRSGTVITSGDTGTVTSTMLADGTIVDADISATASIAGSKLQAATISNAGAVQLTDSTGSTSTTTAATPNSVKSAYDLANAALPKAGGTVTGDVTLNAQSDLRFADSDSSSWVAFQGPATVASNVTWTLPSADGTSGQVLSTNGSGTLSWSTSGGTSITQGNTTAEVIDTGTDGRFVVTTEGSERLRVDSSGRVGIGTTNPGAALDVVGGNAADLNNPAVFIQNNRLLTLRQTSGNWGMGLYVDSSNNSYTFGLNNLIFGTGSSATERFRCDSSGRLLVGTSSARTDLTSQLGTATNGLLQVEAISNSAANNGLQIIGNSAAGWGGLINLVHNGGSQGTNTLSGDNTIGGAINFLGNDGNGFHTAATIECRFDGAPANNSMPGKLSFYTTAAGASSPTERMRISQSGNLSVGVTSDSGFHELRKSGGSETSAIAGFSTSGSNYPVAIYQVTGAGANGATAAMLVGRGSVTSRSINAGGTVNASGADYAEYMIKTGDFTIAKGDVCGVTADGQLTNEFAYAVSFVVKSTNPSYVGGDTWGSEDVVGAKPEADDADALVQWEADLEAARQAVDRIAFAGQVPVNVMGGTPGQYIVPVEAADGGIEGVAKNEADLTLAEYMRAVGKVIAIEDDGRARIIVKVA